MKIKFKQDHKVRQGDGKGPHYRTGEVHEFIGPVARTYALKYIARGYADEVKVEEVQSRATPGERVRVETPQPEPTPEPTPEPQSEAPAMPAPTPETEVTRRARRPRQ